MIEKANEHIMEVLKAGIVIGEKKDCEYYPCHFEGQDCTWCFCPFYPCLDHRTNGKFIKSEKSGKKVWSCIDCRWIHEHENSSKILEDMGSHEKLNSEELKKIRQELFE